MDHKTFPCFVFKLLAACAWLLVWFTQGLKQQEEERGLGISWAQWEGGVPQGVLCSHPPSLLGP